MLIWGLFLGLLFSMTLGLSSRFVLQTDLWAFLPTVGDSPEQRLTRTLLSGRLSQSLVLAVLPGPEACLEEDTCDELAQEKALRITRSLSQELSARPEVKFAQSGPQPGFEDAVHELYFKRRFALAHAGPGKPYSRENLSARLQGLKKFLASPQATMYRSQITSDPLLYFPAQIERLSELKPKNLGLRNGQFSTESKMAVAFVELTPRLSGDQKAALYSWIQKRFAELNNEGPPCLLRTSGALPFEVQGEAQSKADMQRVGLISVVMAVGLSFLLFRSLFALVAVLLPVAFGFVFGCSATLVVFGEVHVLTLAFGASLIGVSLDYPLHLLNEAALTQKSLREAAGRTRPGLLIGCLTTTVGFVTFGLTSATALLQVALFAIFGLLGALCTTLFVVPLLPLTLGSGALQRTLVTSLQRLLPRLERAAMPLLVALLLTLGSSAWWVFTHLDPTNPDTLDPSPLELKRQDAFVRQQLGLSEDMLVSTATDLELALKRTLELADTLEQKTRDGKIESYRALSALYQPISVQSENRKQAAKGATRKRFFAELEVAGFDPSAFEETPLGTKEVEDLPLLEFQELLDSPLGHMAEPFVFKNGQAASVVTQVSASPDEIEAILEAHPWAIHYQPKKFLGLSFSALASNIRKALAVALGLMLLIVAVRNRSVRATASAFLPASTGALGALALVGQFEALHVFHLLAAVVVLSMGIDYGTFMVETHRHQDEPHAWPSVVAAACSTLVSFGCLGLSSVPALRAIGFVVATGITLALLSTPLCYALLSHKGRTQ